MCKLASALQCLKHSCNARCHPCRPILVPEVQGITADSAPASALDRRHLQPSKLLDACGQPWWWAEYNDPIRLSCVKASL